MYSSVDKSQDFSISFEDVYALWQKFKTKNRHLLLIIDSSFSGQWVRKLVLKQDKSMSVQASCQYYQSSVENKRLGGFFIHNLFKTIARTKDENVVLPGRYDQQPCFAGDFQKVNEIFGLRLKFEYWSDFKKAISGYKFSNWPRIEQGEGSGNKKRAVFSLDGEKVYYEGDYDNRNMRSGQGAIIDSKGMVRF